MLAIVLVAAVALAAAGALSTRSTRIEYARLHVSGAQVAPPSRAAVRIASWYARRKSWNGVERALRAQGDRLLLFSQSGSFLGSSMPHLRSAVLLGGPQHLMHLSFKESPRANADLFLEGLPGAAVRDLRGRRVAVLYELLAPSEPRVPAASRLIRQLWLAIGAGLIVALAAAAGISRYVLSPVDALVAMTSAVKSGDLSRRARVRGPRELAELARRFNEMAAHLERSEELRKRMIADIAHELRTPLTNIRGVTEAIQDGHLPADAAALHSLDEETRSLEHLVDDLQDLSLADSHQLSFRMTDLSLGECVRAACDAIAPKIRNRGLRIEFAPAAGDPIVHGDAVRLRQVVGNLLENAARFAPPETVIGVVLERRGHSVRVSVRDAGPGVPQAEIDRIFERFYRADPSRSRKSGGAGLGLAIAEAIVKAHGGTIQAENNAGSGATFWFEIPAVTEPSTP